MDYHHQVRMNLLPPKVTFRTGKIQERPELSVIVKEKAIKVLLDTLERPEELYNDLAPRLGKKYIISWASIKCKTVRTAKMPK